MSKSQTVNIAVALVILCAIIEEPSDATTLESESVKRVTQLDRGFTYPSAVGVHNERKSIELANSVDTGSADFVVVFLGIPQLKVAPGSLRTSGSELKFRSPLRLRNTT